MIRRAFMFAGILSASGLYSYAQQAEPYWRVNAEKTDVAIPEYSGEASPFPYIEPPKVEVVEIFKEPEPVYDPDLIARESRNKKAAEVLSEIRDILLSEAAFNPDLRNVNVNGIIKGEDVNSALIENEWIRSGEELKVPVQAVDHLLSLVGYLRSISPDLSESVQKKIDTKLAEIGNFKLRLDRVENKSVVFKDNRDKTYVILFDDVS
ncbi:MAG: hypothetical protein OSB62_07940 [Alphaproteobacteria bacterium]|nr:hypothetical protein [Alphaproteobacteria bacterium]